MQWIGRRTQASRLVQDNGSVDVLASPVIGNAGEPPLPGLSVRGGGLGGALHDSFKLFDCGSGRGSDAEVTSRRRARGRVQLSCFKLRFRWL